MKPHPFILTITTVLFLSAATGTAQKSTEMEPSLRLAVQLVEESWKMLDATIDEVWPGFNSYDSISYFTAIVNNQDVLINPPGNPKDGFKLCTQKIRDKDIYLRDPGKREKIWGGSYRYKIDGKRIKGVQFHPPSDEYSENGWKHRVDYYKIPAGIEKYRKYCYSPEFFIAIIVHEAFHQFQIVVHKAKSINATHPSPYSLDSSYHALFQKEGDILAEAFLTEDREEVVKLAREFLQIRAERRKRLIAEDIHWERRNEYCEGGAMYFETKMFDVLKAIDYKGWKIPGLQFMGPDFTDAKNEILVYAIKNSPDLVHQPNMEAQHCYFFGLAQCYMLDRLCGQEWKKHYFEEGVWLETLVERFTR